MMIDARAARFSPPVGNDGGRDDERQTETRAAALPPFPELLASVPPSIA